MILRKNLYWLLLVVAGLFEIMWVIGLKHAESPLHWLITVIAIVVSFGLLIYTSKILPTSTAYAVFVGIGAAGTVISEMTVFGEPFHIGKTALVALLIAGIIGLKMVTDDQQNNVGQTQATRKGGQY